MVTIEPQKYGKLNAFDKYGWQYIAMDEPNQTFGPPLFCAGTNPSSLCIFQRTDALEEIQ